MCGCTLYDSPTCGHSWISMSQPCGFLSDLLSCPYRQTDQTLIAPPYTCPTCNGGFADMETIEMIQGPWGCNQMIRSHVGGNYAIPGQWGNARLSMNGLGGPAITSGAMVPMRGYGYDHRLTGPYGHGPMMGNQAMIMNGPVIGNRAMIANGPMAGHSPMVYDGYDGYAGYNGFDDGYISDGYLDGYDLGYGGRRRRKHKSKYKYRYTDKPATNCVVM